MAFRSLYHPSSHIERTNDEAKAKWQKECEALKKSGKDKAEFPDPPPPPPGWEICISDRVTWTCYFLILGMVEWVEHWAFEGEVLGLTWWPRVGGPVHSRHAAWPGVVNGMACRIAGRMSPQEADLDS